MAIHFREGEKLVEELEFHFLRYTRAALCFFALFAWGMLSLYEGFPLLFIISVLLSVVPIIYQRLKGRYSSYLLTNQRIYTEHGLFAKSKFDLPLSRVTDVKLFQSSLQRLLGTGDLFLEREGSAPHVLKNVQNPESLQEVFKARALH